MTVRPETVYVLLSDSDGCINSIPEPFGVAVRSEEEAEKFVREVRWGFRQNFTKVRVFDTTAAAIAALRAEREARDGR